MAFRKKAKIRKFAKKLKKIESKQKKVIIPMSRKDALKTTKRHYKAVEYSEKIGTLVGKVLKSLEKKKGMKTTAQQLGKSDFGKRVAFNLINKKKKLTKANITKEISNINLSIKKELRKNVHKRFDEIGLNKESRAFILRQAKKENWGDVNLLGWLQQGYITKNLLEKVINKKARAKKGTWRSEFKKQQQVLRAERMEMTAIMDELRLNREQASWFMDRYKDNPEFRRKLIQTTLEKGAEKKFRELVKKGMEEEFVELGRVPYFEGGFDFELEHGYKPPGDKKKKKEELHELIPTPGIYVPEKDMTPYWDEYIIEEHKGDFDHDRYAPEGGERIPATEKGSRGPSKRSVDRAKRVYPWEIRTKEEKKKYDDMIEKNQVQGIKDEERRKRTRERMGILGKKGKSKEMSMEEKISSLREMANEAIEQEQWELYKTLMGKANKLSKTKELK